METASVFTHQWTSWLKQVICQFEVKSPAHFKTKSWPVLRFFNFYISSVHLTKHALKRLVPQTKVLFTAWWRLKRPEQIWGVSQMVGYTYTVPEILVCNVLLNSSVVGLFPHQHCLTHKLFILCPLHLTYAGKDKTLILSHPKQPLKVHPVS